MWLARKLPFSPSYKFLSCIHPASMSDILKRGYNYHSFTTLNIPVFPDQGKKASTKEPAALLVADCFPGA